MINRNTAVLTVKMLKNLMRVTQVTGISVPFSKRNKKLFGIISHITQKTR